MLQRWLKFYLDLNGRGHDAGLLFLRVTISLMMIAGHGWGKLLAFGERAASFPDPLGVGNELSMALAIFGEVVCPLFVAAGLLTRVFAFPVLFTMLVAAGIVHADDPWAKQEFALLYAVPYATLVWTGAGRYSVDGWLRSRLQVITD
ncbi:MAG: DoxX family protein [Candidatus Dadabacteria bacterium]|nr:MAG: DoxX family protein [Candidatus Dadabacteria bacterium]